MSPNKGVTHCSILSLFLDLIYLSQASQDETQWAYPILRLQLSMNSNHIMHGYVPSYNRYNLEPNVRCLYHTWPLTRTSFIVSETWLHVKWGMKDSTKYCKTLKHEDQSFLGYNAVSDRWFPTFLDHSVYIFKSSSLKAP
jgi:hypothetical protein